MHGDGSSEVIARGKFSTHGDLGFPRYFHAMTEELQPIDSSASRSKMSASNLDSPLNHPELRIGDYQEQTRKC